MYVCVRGVGGRWVRGCGCVGVGVVVCAIKVKDYVICLYEGFVYTLYKYIMCMRGSFVNLMIDIELLNLPHF